MDYVFVALAKENKSYMGTVDGMDTDTWMSSNTRSGGRKMDGSGA